MTELRQYIISVCAAGILCGIAAGMLPEKGATGVLLRHICGIFLIFVVIQPLTRIDLEALPAISEAYMEDARAATAEGEKLTVDAMADIIKQQTEAYILDKAQAMGAVITAEVTLSADTIPTPTGVRITGTITPYAKSRLQRILAEELGISKENQIWIG